MVSGNNSKSTRQTLALDPAETEILNLYESIFYKETLRGWILIPETHVKLFMFKGRKAWAFATIGMHNRKMHVERPDPLGRDPSTLASCELLGYMSPDWKMPPKMSSIGRKTWFLHAVLSSAQLIWDVKPAVDTGLVLPSVSQKKRGALFRTDSPLSHTVLVDAELVTPKFRNFQVSNDQVSTGPAYSNKKTVRFFIVIPITDMERDYIITHGWSTFSALADIAELQAHFNLRASIKGRPCLIELLKKMNVGETEMQDVAAVEAGISSGRYVLPNGMDS